MLVNKPEAYKRLPYRIRGFDKLQLRWIVLGKAVNETAANEIYSKFEKSPLYEQLEILHIKVTIIKREEI